MNFARGKQMIVFDTGLNELSGSFRMSRSLSLPVAHRRWIVHPQNSINYILNGVAQQAHATGGLDAVHFMGHGSPGSIHLGREAMTMAHIDLFSMLRGQVSVIVFFSCLVGGEHRGGAWQRWHPATFGQGVSRMSGATTVVAQEVQYYTVRGNGQVDFGSWDGPVDVYGDGTLRTYQDPNPLRRGGVPRFNLENVIFG